MSRKSVSDAKRHARMPINSSVLMMRAGTSWATEMVDISATGVMLRRPRDWRGALGDLYSLDMLVGDDVSINVEARIARITDWHLGFAYERIPADKEEPLWNLLGSYADSIETVGN